MTPLPSLPSPTLPSITDKPYRLLLLKYGVKYPDVGRVLTTPATPVTEFDDRLRSLVDDMFLTMYRAYGIGLAAPQVGLGIRLAVIDVDAKHDGSSKLVLVNPKIIDMHGNQTDWEGCLSLPGIREEVERPNVCRVEYQGADGGRHEITGKGLLARALAHEIDHLDGKVYLSRVSRLRRGMAEKRISKLRKRGQW